MFVACAIVTLFGIISNYELDKLMLIDTYFPTSVCRQRFNEYCSNLHSKSAHTQTHSQSQIL